MLQRFTPRAERHTFNLTRWLVWGGFALILLLAPKKYLNFLQGRRQLIVHRRI